MALDPRQFAPYTSVMPALAALLGALILQHAAAQYGHPRCRGMDDAHLEEAIIEAGHISARCLERGGLNPMLGYRIRKVLESKAHVIMCDTKVNLRGAAGQTQHLPFKMNAVVSIDPTSHDKRSGEAVSGSAPQNIDWTVFHELVHAADPYERLVMSNYLHNSGYGMPDGVYGCHLACQGAIASKSSARAHMLIFERLTEWKIPEEERYQCPKSPGNDCSFLKKYAYLCRWWWDHNLDDKGKRGAKAYEAALCIDKARTAKSGPNYPRDTPDDMFAHIGNIASEAKFQAKGSADTELALRLTSYGRLALKLDDAKDGREWTRKWLRNLQEDNQCPVFKSK